MRSLYVRTEFLSIDWKSPAVVRARPLLIELIEYLGDERSTARSANVLPRSLWISSSLSM